MTAPAPIGAPKRYRPIGSVKARVLALLATAPPQGMLVGEVAEALGEPRNLMGVLLNNYVSQGSIRFTGQRPNKRWHAATETPAQRSDRAHALAEVRAIMAKAGLTLADLAAPAEPAVVHAPRQLVTTKLPAPHKRPTSGKPTTVGAKVQQQAREKVRAQRGDARSRDADVTLANPKLSIAKVTTVDASRARITVCTKPPIDPRYQVDPATYQGGGFVDEWRRLRDGAQA